MCSLTPVSRLCCVAGSCLHTHPLPCASSHLALLVTTIKPQDPSPDPLPFPGPPLGTLGLLALRLWPLAGCTVAWRHSPGSRQTLS